MTWERMWDPQTQPVDNHCFTALCFNCNESSELTEAGRGRGLRPEMDRGGGLA